MKPIDRQILSIALPSILSNITVPLLGLVDVAIVGHLGATSDIGAIAVGGMMFNLIYWIFGFLRMGTSGMTSQAYGANNKQEIKLLLQRSLGIAFSTADWHSALSSPPTKYSRLLPPIFIYAFGEPLPCLGCIV